MLVSEAVGAAPAELGVDTVFGVVGGGNFHVTNALVTRGARYVAARHEGGAACVGKRVGPASARPGIVTVHQGPGLTNAITGITEAAKSRTPMLVLAADVAAAAVHSNFRIDVAAIATAIGATPLWLHSSRLRRGRHRSRLLQPRRSPSLGPWCWRYRSTFQAGECKPRAIAPAAAAPSPAEPAADAVAALADFCSSPGPGGRSSSPGARARIASAQSPSWASPAPAARCWRPPPPPRACSAAALGTLTSAAASRVFAAPFFFGADLAGGLGLRAEHVDDAARPPASAPGATVAPGRRCPRRDRRRTAQVDLVRVVGDVGVAARAPQAPWTASGPRHPAGQGPAGRATSPATGRPGCGTGSPARSAGATCPYSVRRATITGIDPRTPVRRRLTTCCPRNGPCSRPQATPWATRACTCPCRTRRLLLHPGVPVSRARPGLRYRVGDGAAGPADRRRARRRRRADGGQRVGDVVRLRPAR